MSSLQILAPGLFGPMPGFQSPPPTRTLRWFLRLLACADLETASGRTPEQLLFNLCGGRGELSAEAALRRLADGAERDDACWIQASPVLLKPDQDRLLLFDAEEFDLSLEEAREIAGCVSEHFADLGWVIEVSKPHRWYLKLQSAPRIESYRLGDVFGRNLFHFLPRGEEARHWRSLINEVQMLLHGLELNRQRELAGQAPVNGLWFSGEGSLGDLTWSDGGRPDVVCSDDAFSKGLALHRDIPSISLAESGDVFPGGGRVVLLWSDLERGVWRADPDQWWQAVEGFAGWLARLLETRSSRFDRIELFPCNGRAYCITPGQRWRFWRHAPNYDSLLDSNVHPD